ncbi:HutD family protein [Zavarzinia compransoris]|uniref:HutD/Ves family protein n=1 Tax=Zavarzinia marina TaxID=2911065 RepID=UPI001F350AB9|nr:HutD family protein [Zavarzinia marina]MCF4167324.1 HutD family protein [Zavarzinia marina]
MAAPVHRLLPAAAHRTMPWANGGGTTAEIAIFPPDAAIAARDFDWRISMARVAADGPFSALAGYDRILTLTAGAGMTLEGPDGLRFVLDQVGDQASFPGDWPLDAHLHGGAIEDLNVMVRRGVHAARADVLRVSGVGGFPLAETSVVVVLAGGFRLAGGPDLAPRDAASITGGIGGWQSLTGSGMLVAVQLYRILSPLDV